MANFLMPKGRVMRDAAAEAKVIDPITTAASGDIRFEQRLTMARGPIGDIAAGAGGVVVANIGDDSVSVLDPATMTVLSTVAVYGEPLAVAVADDRAYVSISSASYDAVSVIDLGTRTVIKTYPLAFGVTALAVAPDGKRVYACRSAQDRVDVAVIDVTAERIGTIDVGHGPAANIDALSVDPSGKRLHLAVTDDSGSRMIVVDTETALISRVVPVGAPIRDISYAGGAVYVLTSDRAARGVVHVIDLSTMRITDRVAVGGAPTQMVMSRDETRAYVVDYDRVTVLSTLTMEVVDGLTVDARPSCVTQDADGSHLFIADYAGGVTTYSVQSAIEDLYSQFLATDPIALSVRRSLQPAHV